MITGKLRTRLDRVIDSWKARPCYICGVLGGCPHRELEVDLAIVDAEIARALLPAKKEIARAPLSVVKHGPGRASSSRRKA